MNTIMNLVNTLGPALIFATGGFFLALLLLIFHGFVGTRIHGLWRIALADIIIPLALIGIIIFGDTDNWISDFLLYPFFMLGVALVGTGYRMFFDNSVGKSLWLYAPVLVVPFLEMLFIAFAIPTEINRVILSWIIAGQFSVIGIILVRQKEAHSAIINQKVVIRGIGAVCFALSGIFLIRGFGFLIENSILYIFSGSYTSIFISMTIGGTLFSFGIVFMGILRLQYELATRELQLTQENYDALVRTIIDTFPQAFILKDVNSKYIFSNSHFALLHNKKPEEIVGLTDADLYPPELAQKYRLDDKEVMDSGLSRSFIEEHELGGERFWIETIKTPVRDTTGVITGILVMFIDISTRIRNQEALKESERKYRELNEQLEKRVEERNRGLREAKRDLDLFFEVTLDYLSIINMNGYFQKVSKSWVTDTGWPEHELVGVSLLRFVPPDDRDKIIEMAKLLLSGVPLRDFHIRFKRADGSWILLSLSAVGVPDRNLVIAAAHDITQQIEIEERLRQARIEAELASKAKSQFIATMSHELRTPLNAVLGYSSLLESFIQDEKGLRYLASIGTAGRSLLSIINDILDFTKAESNRIELVPMPFEIRSIADELLDIFRFNAEEKGLLIQIQITEGVPRTIMLDQNRLRQILVNLMGNAIKFTDAGSVTLFIDAKAEVGQNIVHEGGPNRVHLIIEVTDTGIGISEEFRSHLFDPFTQQDFNIARKYGGTGLGLAISKRLLDLMGGTIRCEAPERGGTRFRIDIPQVPCAGTDVQHFVTFGQGLEERVAENQEIVPMARFDDASLTLLVVGESEDRRTWIRNMLLDKHVNIYETSLDSAHTYPIQKVNGILFDFPSTQPQSESGKELIKKWVQTYKTPLLVIIHSGKTKFYRDNLLSILSIGGLDYVQEPIDPEELWLRLMNQIELKGSRTRIAAVNRVLTETTSRLQQLSVQVDKLNMVDELTGLANRKTLWRWLVQEIGRCKALGNSLAIMLGDMDHLKQINDSYGQSFGDQALIECAHRFARAFENEALLGRWSGEEFLAILPGDPEGNQETHLRSVIEKAQTVRQYVIGEPLIVGPERLTISISIGLTVMTCDGSEDDETMASALLRTVDDALYRAKTKGENHVEVLRFIHPSERPVPPSEGFFPE